MSKNEVKKKCKIKKKGCCFLRADYYKVLSGNPGMSPAPDGLLLPGGLSKIALMMRGHINSNKKLALLCQ